MNRVAERRRRSRAGAWPDRPDVHVRIRPGHVVHLRDVSDEGVRIASSRRLVPGMSVELVIELDGLSHRCRALVVHSCVASVEASALTFESGLALEKRIPDTMLGTMGMGVDPRRERG